MAKEQLQCNEPEECFNCPYPDCINTGSVKTIVKDKNHQQRAIIKTDLIGMFVEKFSGITECCKKEGYTHSIMVRRIKKRVALNGFVYMFEDEYKPIQQKENLFKLDKLDRIVGNITLKDLAREYRTTESTIEYKVKHDYLNGQYRYMFESDYRKMMERKEGKKMEEKKVVKRGRPPKQAEAKKPTVEEVLAQSDPVNHPTHYCTGGIECFDAMRATFGDEWLMHYSVIAAFKYDWRAKHKGSFAEDMKKAAWYNNKAAELSEVLDVKEE